MNYASILLLLATLLVSCSCGVQARRMLESDDEKAARLGLIAEFKGDGTAYSHSVNNATGFACSMREIPPKAKRNFVAINSAQWNNGTDCGKCVEVWCEDSFCVNRYTPVKLMIMDLCPECSKGDLDLSIPAYEEVTGRWPHRLKFAWRYIDCSEEFNFEDQIRMDLKKGPNTWWRAFYFSGNRYPIVNVTLNGRELGRSQFNFFNDWSTLAETGPYKLTLTADTGETIETDVDDVMLSTQYLPIQFSRVDK
mmetsp:Transcript_6942/g.13825  ORF Transcript_6942/g.13825 Transcript_6942/m.13825 type:complete len:252 (+) Transcript_6942:1499-2254(+)